MEQDAIITIIDEQTLRLRKITNFLDDIELVYYNSQRDMAQTVIFSLESAESSMKAPQNSGHYSMTV